MLFIQEKLQVIPVILTSSTLPSTEQISKAISNPFKSREMSESTNLSCYVAGKPIESKDLLEVRSPFDKRLVGTVVLANASHTQKAIEAGLAGGKKLSRYERYLILDKTRQFLVER